VNNPDIRPDGCKADISAAADRRYTGRLTRKASVILEKDEHGFYAWCAELKGCQSQGDTLEEALENIKEAIELYLETLPVEERRTLLSREILTTAVEVNA
jgi:predicted RNase H-like HicB family nuclease